MTKASQYKETEEKLHSIRIIERQPAYQIFWRQVVEKFEVKFFGSQIQTLKILQYPPKGQGLFLWYFMMWLTRGNCVKISHAITRVSFVVASV